MNVTTLSPSCSVIGMAAAASVPSVTVMVDCGLDTRSMLRFLPCVEPVGSGGGGADGGASAVSGSTASSLGKATDSDPTGLVSVRGGGSFLATRLRYSAPAFESYDVASLDAVLISNVWAMLALPYLTEYTAFAGPILATEPTVQLGKAMLQELVDCDSLSTRSLGMGWQGLLESLPPDVRLDEYAAHWKAMYTSEDVESCIGKLTPMSFNESLDVVSGCRITPVCSGYTIGGANWLIEAGGKKVAVITAASAYATNAREMDTSALAGADVLYMTQLAGEDEAMHGAGGSGGGGGGWMGDTVMSDGLAGGSGERGGPTITTTTSTSAGARSAMLSDGPSWTDSVRALCSRVGADLEAGDGVLLPVTSSGGLALEIIDTLQHYLNTVNLGHIPILFISPVAESVLAYSNIAAEWLCESRQEKVYIPQAPFAHSDLVQTGRLRLLNRVDSGFGPYVNGPVVVVASHSSLRCGPAVDVLNLWRHNARRSVVFTQPEVDYVAALAPFQPLSIRAYSIPLQQRLSPSHAAAVVRAVLPSQVLTTFDPALLELRGSEATRVPVPGGISLEAEALFERAILDFSLAERLEARVTAEGSVAAVAATLLARTQEPVYELAAPMASHASSARLLTAPPIQSQVLSYLTERLGWEAVLSQGEGGGRARITVTGKSAAVVFGPQSTEIEASDEATRRALQEAVIAASAQSLL